jgi:hypothetical protein
MILIDKTNIRALDNECEIFAKYLIGKSPNSYVKEKYYEAHKVGTLARIQELSKFDNYLVNLARKHILFVSIIDSYACILYKKSLLRKKLILLLSIMESCYPTYVYFNDITYATKTFTYIRMIYNVIFFILKFLCSTVFIMVTYTALKLSRKI